jgi:hypothetical protein
MTHSASSLSKRKDFTSPFPHIPTASIGRNALGSIMSILMSILARKSSIKCISRMQKMTGNMLRPTATSNLSSPKAERRSGWYPSQCGRNQVSRCIGLNMTVHVTLF